MAKGASTPTRVNADVAATAAAVASTEHRTVTEQINYWTRIGMHVERCSSAESRRLIAVASGDAQFSALSADDRTIAHALIDARIAERAVNTRFGAAARKAGQVSVSIDDAGNLIEIAADGSRRSR